MAGTHSFNDIQRGVPLISRAVLVARLRELEAQGVIETTAGARTEPVMSIGSQRPATGLRSIVD